ncbi:MAG: hypothetical protein FWB86_06840 [Treponema sp.]|nr:hypothetical protein [Treponema sp.]MCL2250862.1 hypothetical protein [Treponema sp.]
MKCSAGIERTIFSAAFFFAVLQIYPIPLESLVNPSQAQRLAEKDELIVSIQLVNNPAPALLPVNNELRQAVAKARTSFNPNMLVESLYLYKKPESFHTSVSVWNEPQRTGVFNQAVALGTLTGVQYFSASRRELRTFYEYSAVIDGPQTKKPIPDPVYLQPPAALTLYARQRDLTFGDNIYSYNYAAERDVIIFTQENVTSLSVGIIPVISRGNLRSVMAVIDCGDSILIYAVSMVNALSIPGMRDRISNSFSSRAEAVLKWFTNRLDNQLFN